MNNAIVKSSERTARAVATQVSGMGCTSYEIGVLDAGQGQMLLRPWTVAELEHGLPWLKRANAQGHDIYIRPEGSAGLILLDDLDAAAIGHLKHDGLAPAVVVETSPRNYQAWLRVSLEPIAPDQATMVARILAERYGGDLASADWRHFGRLAGFTNRKPKRRQRGGTPPFVLVREAPGVAAERGAQLLIEAAVRVQAIAAAQEAVRRIQPVTSAPGGLRSPGAAYALSAEWMLARYPKTDLSRLDWMVCRDLASGSLAVDEQYLQRALREGSPHLAERKVGHVDDYVARTASKVMRDATVLSARKRLASGDVTFQVGG
jgi:RepB DNA-primase from phage plasmid